MSTEVGVIADTHGLLRPEAASALAGVDLIIHAGDIGSPDVLEELARIAPVTAVRGNNDKGAWAEALANDEVVQVESAYLYVVHELEHLDLDPAAAEFQAVITGHSHRPSTEVRDGVLFLNPGSAGPRRFTLPIALARLSVNGSQLSPELIQVEP